MIGYHYNVKKRKMKKFPPVDILQITSFLFSGSRNCGIVSNKFEVKHI